MRIFAVWATLVAASACGGSTPSTAGPPTVTMVTPVGQPAGPAVSQSIGPAGGTLATADGDLEIIIPAGALAAPTTITLEPVVNETVGGLGLAYHLAPEGTTFAVPVSLRFAVGPDELATAKIAFQREDGSWSPVRITARDATAGRVTVETSHFSNWARLTGVRLTPLQATVQPSQELELQLEVCVELPDGCIAPEDEVCVFTCYGQGQVEVPGVNWAVNGIEWGNQTIGQIYWGDATGRGRFHAPAVAPSPATVQVSATCGEACSAGNGRVIVVSQITIGAHGGFAGTVTSREVTDLGPSVVTTTTSATVTFGWDEALEAYTPVEGTARITYDVAAPGCEVHASYEGPLGAMDGNLFVADGTYVPFGVQVGVPLTGTTTCTSSGAPEPVSLPNAVPWWPAVGNNTYTVKPDGSLAESVMLATPGRTIMASWSFAPR